MKGAIPMRAASISFRIFLAFFPGIILLLSLIPYIPVPDFQENMMHGLQSVFPGDTFSLFEKTLDDLINKKHNTLLSVGFVLTIFYASSSINAILMGFNSSYNLEERGNPWMMRLASIVLIFVLGIFMIIAVSLIVFSDHLFAWIRDSGILSDNGARPLFNLVQWLITVFLVYTVISTLYQVGTPKRRKLRYFNTGATFATIFFILASVGFAYFVNNFAQYNKLYGSLGTLLVLLIWLEFNCTILLLGFELNVSISKARRNMPIPKVVIRNTIKDSDVQ
ncbi:MAG: YihY/virulence factor BrkB family protein [Flavobacteriales bacterium]|nr:YihY/virulence factor BrkB family protein [Flavobacteriales bacterium]